MWFLSEQEEQRFVHALLASLVVHVLVLGYVKGVEPLRKAGYAGALSVSFRSVAAADPAPVADVPAPRQPAAITTDEVRRSPLRIASPPPVPPKPAPAVRPTPNPPRPAAPTQAREPRASAAPARPRQARAPGIVDVTLVVGADGHPSGIYWDRLPALTNVQFQQLEAIIRRQTYPSTSGARLTQEIDVFALLGIGRGASQPGEAPAIVRGPPTP